MPNRADAPKGAHLPDLYASDTAHGWSIGMRHITRAMLRGATRQNPTTSPGLILELGCGGGGLLPGLQTDFATAKVVGSDLNPLAIAHAQTTEPQALLYQGDLHHLPLADATASVILILDTLDQSGVAPDAALVEAARVLKPGGTILARVSAYPWLMGPHDAAFNTSRRYTRSALRALFQTTGFTLCRATYANTTLGLAAVPVRLLQRWGLGARDNRHATSSPLARTLLVTLLQLEARWLAQGDMPFGLSLYILAQKQPVTADRSVATTRRAPIHAAATNSRASALNRETTP